MIEKDGQEKIRDRKKKGGDLKLAGESKKEMGPKREEKKAGQRGAKELETGMVLKRRHRQGCLNKML